MLLYKIYGNENDMVFWNTYFSVIYAGQKEINGRHFPAKIMITIGRELKPEINKEDLKNLPDEYKKKFEQESGKSVRTSLIGFFKSAYLKVGKFLGINVSDSEKEKRFQIYEYMKINQSEDGKVILENMLFGLGLAYGLLGKKLKIPYDVLIERAEEIVDRGIRKGLEK